MSSAPQVVSSSGELSPLDLFGCRTNSPPMTTNQLSVLSHTGTSAAGASQVLQPTLVVRDLKTTVGVPDATIVETKQPSNEKQSALDSVVDDAPDSIFNAVAQPAYPTAGDGTPTPKKVKPSAAKRVSVATQSPVQTPSQPPLNRIAKVREQQGISERTMARRLGIDIKSYRQLEDPYCNLTLSELNAIQRALEVPLADLLEECQGLSRPVEERAKLLKIMKTAVALREAKINARADRMAQMLCDQLIDLMPELAEVSGWPQFGARRGISAVGKALQQPIDTSNITFQD